MIDCFLIKCREPPNCGGVREHRRSHVPPTAWLPVPLSTLHEVPSCCCCFFMCMKEDTFFVCLPLEGCSSSYLVTIPCLPKKSTGIFLKLFHHKKNNASHTCRNVVASPLLLEKLQSSHSCESPVLQSRTPLPTGSGQEPRQEVLGLPRVNRAPRSCMLFA